MKAFNYGVEDQVAIITFDIEGESVNTLSPLLAWAMKFCLFAFGTARTKPSM